MPNYPACAIPNFETFKTVLSLFEQFMRCFNCFFVGQSRKQFDLNNVTLSHKIATHRRLPPKINAIEC